MANKDNDFDYTIVMDARYPGLDPAAKDEAAEAAANSEKGAAGAPAGSPKQGARPAVPTPEPQIEYNDYYERLYAEYEEMALKEPTILDIDDAYPHSYQWRVGDRYDPAKIEVLKAALSQGKRITDTEEYKKYLESFKTRRFKPESWD